MASLVACAWAATPPSFVFILTDDQDLLLNGTSTMPVLAREMVEQGLALQGYVVSRLQWDDGIPPAPKPPRLCVPPHAFELQMCLFLQGALQSRRGAFRFVGRAPEGRVPSGHTPSSFGSVVRSVRCACVCPAPFPCTGGRPGIFL
jgi:hypothetical protein